MDHHPVDRDACPSLETGTLRNGDRYDIIRLGPGHLDAIEALHDATIATLRAEESVFMLPKSRADLAANLQKPDGNGAIGVVSGGRLIAQIMIVHPAPGSQDQDLAAPLPGIDPGQVSILGGACVSPEFRGSGLMNRLVWHWLDHAAAHGRSEAVAEIDIRNVASWAAFIAGGLSLRSLTTDPRDGGEIYTAHETVTTARALRLTDAFNRHGGMTGARCSIGDFATQKMLMAQSYRAIAWDRAQQQFVMKQLPP